MTTAICECDQSARCCRSASATLSCKAARDDATNRGGLLRALGKKLLFVLFQDAQGAFEQLQGLLVIQRWVAAQLEPGNPSLLALHYAAPFGNMPRRHL